MRRCIGSPCSTYLVLRSNDVSPEASRPSPPLMSASGFCVPVPVTSGRTGAVAAAGNFENFKKMSFFSKHIFHMLCPVPACILSVFL
ncbi:unnamed protein product, partial [Staurois parvus]